MASFVYSWVPGSHGLVGFDSNHCVKSSVPAELPHPCLLWSSSGGRVLGDPPCSLSGLALGQKFSRTHMQPTVQGQCPKDPHQEFLAVRDFNGQDMLLLLFFPSLLLLQRTRNWSCSEQHQCLASASPSSANKKCCKNPALILIMHGHPARVVGRRKLAPLETSPGSRED